MRIGSLFSGIGGLELEFVALRRSLTTPTPERAEGGDDA